MPEVQLEPQQLDAELQPLGVLEVDAFDAQEAACWSALELQLNLDVSEAELEVVDAPATAHLPQFASAVESVFGQWLDALETRVEAVPRVALRAVLAIIHLFLAFDAKAAQGQGQFGSKKPTKAAEAWI